MCVSVEVVMDLSSLNEVSSDSYCQPSACYITIYFILHLHPISHLLSFSFFLFLCHFYLFFILNAISTYLCTFSILLSSLYNITSNDLSLLYLDLVIFHSFEIASSLVYTPFPLLKHNTNRL